MVIVLRWLRSLLAIAIAGARARGMREHDAVAGRGASYTSGRARDRKPIPRAVLEAITFHTAIRRSLVVYPEFHVREPSGTVRYIHRELMATNDPGLEIVGRLLGSWSSW